ncbi:hypothetical protein [Acanthopleuribacter pedis]|uniref:Uncharacterized protein n=1 Tax=Acanthopleuribacter pedis TaxID=442870 RepID=A0A8J7QGH9_9BACT|nr:hypothetical protein [Acanthopleuribacter pedis]MBO1321855.1 hypothetical protein [Acanthopleuribacter pedis]
MIHVTTLCQSLTESGRVRAIRRYNLRKFCRSLNLPPCGLSFWAVDDLNYDYLNDLNRRLRHDQFRFQGGSFFPRAYLDDCAYGNKRRTEFIFLTTRPSLCSPWYPLLDTCFGETVRTFGDGDWFGTTPAAQNQLLRAQIKRQFVLDLMHFSGKEGFLGPLADFHLGLFLLTLDGMVGAQTPAELIELAKTVRPEDRAQLTRIKTTGALEARLDEVLFFMNQKLEND